MRNRQLQVFYMLYYTYENPIISNFYILKDIYKIKLQYAIMQLIPSFQLIKN